MFSELEVWLHKSVSSFNFLVYSLRVDCCLWQLCQGQASRPWLIYVELYRGWFRLGVLCAVDLTLIIYSQAGLKLSLNLEDDLEPPPQFWFISLCP